MVGERHHLGIAGATDYCFLPDDPQGGDDLLVARAGGADDADGSVVDGIVHAHTGTGCQGEAVLHAIAHPDLNGVVPGAIDTGDAQTLGHGGGVDIVVPGQPVLARELLERQSHHLRVGGTETRFLPDDPQGGDDLLISRAGGADDAHRTIVDRIVHAHTGIGCQGEAFLQCPGHIHFDRVVATAIDTGDAQTLVHGSGIDIVVPGEPVLIRELLDRQSHHLRIAVAYVRFLPDHPQRSQNVIPTLTVDPDRSIVDRITDPHTLAILQREAVQFGGSQHDLDGRLGAIHIGDPEPLVHGGAVQVVVPRQPVVTRDLLDRQSHHFRVARPHPGFLPDHPQCRDDVHPVRAHHRRRTIIRCKAMALSAIQWDFYVIPHCVPGYLYIHYGLGQIGILKFKSSQVTSCELRTCNPALIGRART